MFRISKEINLPSDAITQTFGFFGRKESGKTYAAGKLSELFLDAEGQVVILDPVGNWYGLRLSKTGKRPSKFKIPILGGLHGDIPLEPAGGITVADFVVSTGTSVILDVSQFRKNQRKQFVTDFAEEFFHLKKSSPSPCHVVLEEAHVFAPASFKGQERMLGAIEDIVRLGRNFGLGSSIVSQRPQSVNTEVRNQCEPLIVLQLVAKHERDAIAGWMQHMGVDSELASLSKLKNGECFFWSPAWLDIFTKTKFYEKETYDASATPKIGAKHRSPNKLKPVDLKGLHKAMAETIKEAKANDPKELKKEIANLKRELKSKNPIVDNKAIERAVEERDRHWQNEIKKIEKNRQTLAGKLSKIHDLSQLNGDASVSIEFPPKTGDPVHRPAHKPIRKRQDPPQSTGDIQLKKAERLILRAFYWLQDEEVTKAKVAFYSGYSAGSGGFNNALGKLRTLGLVDGWKISPSGETMISPDVEPKPTGVDLREWLRPKLKLSENIILDVLINACGERLTNDEIAERSNYSAGSGGFNNALGRLRTLEAAEGYEKFGGTKAADVFFE